MRIVLTSLIKLPKVWIPFVLVVEFTKEVLKMEFQIVLFSAKEDFADSGISI
jgi:hypothetical protein